PSSMPLDDAKYVGARASGGAEAAGRPLLSVLAHTAKASEILPHLHQHALETTGGDCSLLFQHNPRNGMLQPTSGFGLDVLRTDPWVPDGEEAALVALAFERGQPIAVPDVDQRMPDLASRLSARGALLLPLAQGGERRGLVAIGFARGAVREPDD